MNPAELKHRYGTSSLVQTDKNVPAAVQDFDQDILQRSMWEVAAWMVSDHKCNGVMINTRNMQKYLSFVVCDTLKEKQDSKTREALITRVILNQPSTTYGVALHKHLEQHGDTACGDGDSMCFAYKKDCDYLHYHNQICTTGSYVGINVGNKVKSIDVRKHTDDELHKSLSKLKHDKGLPTMLHCTVQGEFSYSSEIGEWAARNNFVLTPPVQGEVDHVTTAASYNREFTAHLSKTKNLEAFNQTGTIHVFTDASYSSHTKSGGVVSTFNQYGNYSYAFHHTKKDINLLERMAVLEGIRKNFVPNTTVVIHSDSTCAVEGFIKVFNGTKKGDDLDDVDREFKNLMKRTQRNNIKVVLQHVRAHGKEQDKDARLGNRVADRIAFCARKNRNSKIAKAEVKARVQESFKTVWSNNVRINPKVREDALLLA